MKKLFYFAGLLLVVSFSCVRVNQKPEQVIENKAEKDFAGGTSDHLIMSILWYQKSAEMRAGYYQAFNLARRVLDENLKQIEPGKKPAVVVDIDETVLDNSPFETRCVNTQVSYSGETWNEWTSTASAKALPGAVEFLSYANSMGVEVFYISNRKHKMMEITMMNLLNCGFPNVEADFMLFKDSTNSKEGRRKKIAENYSILVLVGDNLTDFHQAFETRGEDNAFGLVDQYKEKFGSRFIILPNPMYGDWETIFFEKTKDLTDKKKYEIRKKLLIDYKN